MKDLLTIKVRIMTLVCKTISHPEFIIPRQSHILQIYNPSTAECMYHML